MSEDTRNYIITVILCLIALAAAFYIVHTALTLP